MNSSIKNLFIFAVGAAIGSAVTWKLVKDKYESLANEEIASAYEHMKHSKNIPLFSDDNSEDSETDSHVTLDKLREYKAIVDKYAAALVEEEVNDVEKPYVIKPEEFGEILEYESISLTYYADGVLADEYDEVIDDVDEIVGEKSLTTFGQYEDSAVFVRNDARKTDYEILLDLRNYSDVVG